MNIKHLISRILIIWPILFGIIACDDKLDEPLDQEFLIEDADYTETEDMDLVLLGSYGHFYNLQWENYPLISVRGDDVNAAGDQFPLTETDEFRYEPDFWIYNSVWLNLYGDLFAFNAAIEEIEKYREFAESTALADQYKAEIQVMKAFEMLQLIRLWGGIFIPETPLATELYDLQLTPPDTALQYISDLMDEAAPHLLMLHPNERTDIPGGITRYTALAVKALANLDLKNWEEVASATSEIINSNVYSLEPDYYNLFKTEGKLNDEIILEFQYSDYGQSSGESNSYLHAFFGPQNWTPAVEGASGGWGFYEPSLKYIKFMLDRGEQLRLETTVLFTDAGISEIQSDPDYSDIPAWISNTTRDGDVLNDYARANFASGKHYLPSNELTPGRTNYGENKNFIGIRYAEILLTHAEALVMGASGSSISADEAVNRVRSRAGLDTLEGVGIEEVIREKFAELAMEWGIRFYDLVRHDMTQELDYAGRTYESPDDRYIPYPLAQRDLLPELSND
jgi:hypothetical protein